MAAEEEENFSGRTSLRSGAKGNLEDTRPMTAGENPNAIRWLFNPFDVIDLRNEPTSCGMPYLENIVFNRVKSLDVSIGKSFEDTNQLPGTSHNPENYNNFARTSYMIARELCGKHGDKGVIEISELTGYDDDTPANLNTLLFGDEIECAVDLNNPDFPVPNLPNLLEVLEANAAGFKRLDAGTREIVTVIARNVRQSIALAIRYARARIDEAQKRLLDEKNPNRTLSAAEKRCYLALGEEIPNQMPFLTKSKTNPENLVATAVAAGVQAALAVLPQDYRNAPSAPEPENFAPAAPATAPDFSVDEGDVEQAEKTVKTTVKTGKK